MRGGSILTGGLPDSVTVGGVQIPVETDYRLGLLTGALAEDPNLREGDRMALLLRLYCRKIPEGVDPEELTLAILDFYAMDPERKRPAQSGGKREPVYDFETDGDRILASFRLAYGIDLTEVRMHWWKFMILLFSLPEDTPFMQAVRLRTMDLTEVQDDGLRRKLRQARGAVRIRKQRHGHEKGEDRIWQTEV